MVIEADLSGGLKAISALIENQKKTELWKEGDKLFCQITLHKIPKFPKNGEIRKTVELPNRIYSKNISICLFSKTLDEKDADGTVEQVQDILKAQEITFIDSVIPIEKLKKEYKGHELKRKLAQQFDVFFVDGAVSRLVQPHLGKEFRQRRKVPFNIRMEHPKAVKKEMESYLRTTQVILTSKGVNLNICFGNTEMTDEEKVQNLTKLIESLPEIIPRGIKNVKAMCLQGTNTKGVPIYRNAEVSEEINKLSGLEIELQSKHESVKEILSELQAKAKPAKTVKNTDDKKKVKKRKLIGGKRKAKRAKISAE